MSGKLSCEHRKFSTSILTPAAAEGASETSTFMATVLPTDEGTIGKSTFVTAKPGSTSSVRLSRLSVVGPSVGKPVVTVGVGPVKNSCYDEPEKA